MVNVFMLSTVMLNILTQSFLMLSAVILNAVMLNVITQSALMLNDLCAVSL